MTPTQITEAQRLADALQASADYNSSMKGYGGGDEYAAADLLRTLAAQAAQAQQPAGKLHADGYFTWHRRDGYVLDKRLPCEFYLTPQPAREGLTDAQIERHTLTASDCPPNSQVILVSSLHRLLGIGTAGAQEGGR